MKILVIIARVLLGLVFVVFGLNGFLNFMPAPPLTGHAAEFIGAMAATGYMPVVFALQIIGGLLVLVGKVPLGLIVLCPIVVNILLYHVTMNREGLPVAIVVAILSLFLLWSYRSNFAGVFKS